MTTVFEDHIPHSTLDLCHNELILLSYDEVLVLCAVPLAEIAQDGVGLDVDYPLCQGLSHRAPLAPFLERSLLQALQKVLLLG